MCVAQEKNNKLIEKAKLATQFVFLWYTSTPGYCLSEPRSLISRAKYKTISIENINNRACC